jgi:hypothetical protein
LGGEGRIWSNYGVIKYKMTTQHNTQHNTTQHNSTEQNKTEHKIRQNKTRQDKTTHATKKCTSNKTQKQNKIKYKNEINRYKTMQI